MSTLHIKILAVYKKFQDSIGVVGSYIPQLINNEQYLHKKWTNNNN